MRNVLIAPSLLAADKNNFQKEIDRLKEINISYLHFDVMDIKFIGHNSFSFDDFKITSKMHGYINDVHLMTVDPYEYAKEYAKLGADLITIHYEALKDKVDRYDCIMAIKNLGVKVGMSIKPKTKVEEILPYLNLLDLVLIMSVEPGLGGQSFMENALDKIIKCREYIDANNLKTLIEVDGGINEVTGAKCYKAGADILVAGTYLFKAKDIKENFNKLVRNCYE